MKKIVSFLLVSAMMLASTAAFADEEIQNPTGGDPQAQTSQSAPVGDGSPGAVTTDSVPVKDSNAITILVNGKELVTDVPAQIINDRTMLPMRAIFEELGAKVEWMEKDKAIFATKGATMVVMRVGNSDMLVSDFVKGDENFTLDVVPQIVDDRTLVPVRAVSEALGCTVDWDGETRTVTITG